MNLNTEFNIIKWIDRFFIQPFFLFTIILIGKTLILILLKIISLNFHLMLKIGKRAFECNHFIRILALMLNSVTEIGNLRLGSFKCD